MKTYWRLFGLLPAENVLVGPQTNSTGLGRVRFPGRFARAVCLIDSGHRPPEEGCHCGIYAAPDRRALRHLYCSLPRVVAKVTLDGPVMADPLKGFASCAGAVRASGVRIESLHLEGPAHFGQMDWWVRDRADSVVALRTRYGVIVTA